MYSILMRQLRPNEALTALLVRLAESLDGAGHIRMRAHLGAMLGELRPGSTSSVAILAYLQGVENAEREACAAAVARCRAKREARRQSSSGGSSVMPSISGDSKQAR